MSVRRLGAAGASGQGDVQQKGAPAEADAR